MPKAVFAAALAVGLVIALMPQLISSAAAQQKTIASDKNAKTKQGAERRAARPRASGRKNVPPSGKEAKAANKVEMGATWPKFWSDCNNRLKSDSK